MNIAEKQTLILKMNEGSYLKYEPHTKKYVITVNKRLKINLPEDCKIFDQHVCEKFTGFIVCQICFE